MDFEFTAYNNPNPGEERLRLWNIERQPEIELKFKEMKRDGNAALGQRIRDILLERPGDHHAVLKLCREAEEQEAELQRALNEGLKVEADQLWEKYMLAAFNHPGEQDPSHIIRERLKSPAGPVVQPYYSPVLMETLFWEGMHQMPDTHRKMMELDFPDRVNALLDFHCIAFHADVNVFKELYDEKVKDDKDKKKEILNMHRSKMEALMMTLSEDMKQNWKEETDRRLSKLAQGSTPDLPVSHKENDWMGSVSPPTTSRVRKRAHMADPPSIVGAAARKSKTAQAHPIRGILKNASAGVSGTRNAGSVTFNPNNEATFESIFDDDGFDEGAPSSFFLQELIDGAEAPEELDTTYQGPEIVLASSNRRFTSASQSQPSMYEMFRPFRPNTEDSAFDSMPRAVNNVATLTQSFEERMGKGKGKAKTKAAR